MRIKNIIFHNFWAKFFSLVLAVTTWFYVFDLINSGESYAPKKQTIEDLFAKYKFIVKEVSVKPVFFGKPPQGYQVLFDDVTVTPAKISIYGPEDIMQNVEDLKTEKIYIGEYTRTFTLKVGLVSENKMLKFNDKTVEVYIPVKRLVDKKSNGK